MHYAKGTSVPVDRTKAEIERTLQRFGATQVMYGWQANMAVVEFAAMNKRVRFVMHMPDREDKRIALSKQGYRRGEGAIEDALAQITRQYWRNLLLLVKAKLAAVEAGITTFEEEFLSHIVIPAGKGRTTTAGEWLIPQLASSYEKGGLPPLLPSGKTEE